MYLRFSKGQQAGVFLMLLSFVVMAQPFPRHIIASCSKPVSLARMTRRRGKTDLAIHPEYFSVAPMMGHTNRHYHYFFRRYFSQHAFLYTQMIPATQIINWWKKTTNDSSSSSSLRNLQELLHISPLSSSSSLSTLRKGAPIILQLGGRDPKELELATQIALDFDYFSGINLNCGCPSNRVALSSDGDGAFGCALMRDPSLVATCVQAMSHVIDQHNSNNNNMNTGKVELSVKHRLGAREASDYDAQYDRAQNDDQAYQECKDFIQAITCNSLVSKLHVHARLGLLGNFGDSSLTSLSSAHQLWSLNNNKNNNAAEETATGELKKLNHKRIQNQAKQRARLATINNRRVPPLRPKVVERLAETFPSLEFLANGGIQSMQDIHDQLSSPTKVLGAMVGRAVINHPCSFSAVDQMWSNHDDNDFRVQQEQQRQTHDHMVNQNDPPTTTSLTRGQVLESYIQYAQEEEEINKGAMFQALPPSTTDPQVVFKRRLVAVPFALFAGENGSDSFQRSIRKLINSKSHKMSAASILKCAMNSIPITTLDKKVTEYTLLDNSKLYTEFSKKSGPFQRIII